MGLARMLLNPAVQPTSYYVYLVTYIHTFIHNNNNVCLRYNTTYFFEYLYWINFNYIFCIMYYIIYNIYYIFIFDWSLFNLIFLVLYCTSGGGTWLFFNRLQCKLLVKNKTHFKSPSAALNCWMCLIYSGRSHDDSSVLLL